MSFRQGKSRDDPVKWTTAPLTRSFTMNAFFSPSIQDYVEQLRLEIDAALDTATTFGGQCPVRLAEAIRYSLLSPGKRLRPVLLLVANELCGGHRADAMPAACAVEMIHAYSLVHDDLPAMDDDDLRRGRLTCHKKFDEATAILVGDALQALAFEMIGRLTSPELAGRCCSILAELSGPCWLVGGQMDDIATEKGFGFSRTATPRELMELIHRRKTAAMIDASLRLGGMIAGAPPEHIELLGEFGRNFGLAFQITDDLLDYLGDEEFVGKRLNKDAIKKKLSYPTLLGIEESQREAEAAVDKACAAIDQIPTENRLAYETLTAQTRYLLVRKK